MNWLPKRIRIESATNQEQAPMSQIDSPQAGRNSRFATIIRKLDLIMRESEEVAELLSKTIFELQKPMEYYGRLRESMLVGLQSAGVDLPPETSIEQEIAEYVPKNYRREPAVERDEADLPNRGGAGS
jgi:NTP pyrophosphatase (non-canonical NTP hydrolase)